MFPIKLDKTNIILLAVMALLALWSVFVPVPAGGFFPLILAILLIAFVRTLYFNAGKQVALLAALLFLMVPLVLFGFHYALTSHTPGSYLMGKVLPWVLIFFAVLLVVGVLYTATRITIAVASPRTSDEIEKASISRDAKAYFGFLLDRGYRISNVEYVSHYLAGWHCRLDSADDTLSIVLDEQSLPVLAFGKDKTDKRYQIYLQAMIYYLSRREVFIGVSHDHYSERRSRVFKDTARLLRTYLEQIENYLRDDFESTKDRLSEFQEQYLDLLRKSMRR
jgi:hypothetical protein